MQQANLALDETQTLATQLAASDLMEKICEPENLMRAFKRVKANKGAAGIDRMTVDALLNYLQEHGRTIRHSLLKGRYRPQPVKGVRIPKPNGGQRQLGIPTVMDRLIQQAIHQVLEPLIDPTFSDSSFGFRPKRSAHQALQQASDYVAQGRGWVVDLDLEKFFDQVNHDLLMSRLANRINDKRVLKLIRNFLQAGMLQDGCWQRRPTGTPQGGPLSPLLSNILLDELDKELERRGHCFCRYADDCNIYVSSQAAGDRVLQSVEQFLKKRLKLKLNAKKSACARVDERQFLSHRLLPNGALMISDEAEQRMRKQVIRLSKRNRGVSLTCLIESLNRYLRGWLMYFRLSKSRTKLLSLDGWIRRRLRCYRLRQRKRTYPLACWLISQGVSKKEAWKLALSSKGWWRKARTPAASYAMPNSWFEEQGLYSLLKGYEALQH